jgi:Ca2+-binding RTX toxin-like protein
MAIENFQMGGAGHDLLMGADGAPDVLPQNLSLSFGNLVAPIRTTDGKIFYFYRVTDRYHLESILNNGGEVYNTQPNGLAPGVDDSRTRVEGNITIALPTFAEWQDFYYDPALASAAPSGWPTHHYWLANPTTDVSATGYGTVLWYKPHPLHWGPTGDGARHYAAFEVLWGPTDDTLLGEAGNDTLIGGAGNNTLDGGEGIDTADYSEKNAAVSITLSRSRWADVHVGNVREDRIKNIENVTGGSGNDVLAGDTLNNVLRGEAGDDRIDGRTGNDVLYGGAGNDSLTGGAGNDVMVGGTGDDVYDVDSSADIVAELAGEGMDTVRTSLSNYTLTNGTENLIFTGPSNSILTGNTLSNQITGGRRADILNGGEGNDLLKGGRGNDTLLGGVGDDYLNGGTELDRLTGGAGADQFVFDTVPNSRTNVDIITDFSSSNGDKLVFEDTVFARLSGGVNADTLRVNNTGLAQDANDYLILNSTNGKLFYDADGNGRGAGIEVATLTGVSTLSHDDFFII